MEIGCCRKVSHDGQSYGTKHILSHQNSLLHVLADGHCSAIFFKGYIKRSFWNKLRLSEKSNNEKDDICWNQHVNGLKALDKFDKAVETSFNSELNKNMYGYKPVLSWVFLRFFVFREAISTGVLFVSIMIHFDRFWVIKSYDYILCYDIFVEINAKCNITKCYEYESEDVFLYLGILNTYIYDNKIYIVHIYNMVQGIVI